MFLPDVVGSAVLGPVGSKLYRRTSALQGELLRAQLKLERTLERTGRIVAEAPIEIGTVERLAIYDARSDRLLIGRDVETDSIMGGHEALAKRFGITSSPDQVVGGVVQITENGDIVFSALNFSGTYPASRFEGNLDRIRGLGVTVRWLRNGKPSKQVTPSGSRDIAGK